MKTTTLQIRLEPSEKQLLEQLAEKEGFSNPSEYCRWIIRGYARPKVKLMGKDALIDNVNNEKAV
jgi:hypothetical protein